MAERRVYNVRTSSLGTVIGMTLTLLMLGLLGFLLINARQLEQHFKENVKVIILLRRDVKEVEVMRFSKQLDVEPYTHKTLYVTADSAAALLKQDLGEDFLGVLGENTLKPSIELNVKDTYTHPDSLAWIAKELRQDPHVDEVSYNPMLVENMNQGFNKLRWILVGFSALLLFIAVALINNTIRLAIYSKRFLIRTMHLVGATSWFIKRPFLGKSLWQGLISAVFAMGMVVGMVQLAIHFIPDLSKMIQLLPMLILLSGVLIAGLLLSLVSTWFAVRRYLRMDTDELNWS